MATATPDPNKYKEIIHYAGYLEVMDTGQALTRFFKRDSTKANNLTLYPHKEQEFWLWVSSWALFLSSPADLGFDATGYDLPNMSIRYHKLKSDVRYQTDRRNGQVEFEVSAAQGLMQAAREKRSSLEARVACMKEIVESSPEEHFILWHDLEDERRAIKRALPEAVEVYGSQDLDIREKTLSTFRKAESEFLPPRKRLAAPDATFRGTATELSSWVSTTNLTILFRRYTGYIVFADGRGHY